MALPEEVALTVALDSDVALLGLARAASAAGRTVGVLVEMDVGLGRVGVQTPAESSPAGGAGARSRRVWSTGASCSYPGHIRMHVSEADAGTERAGGAPRGRVRDACGGRSGAGGRERRLEPGPCGRAISFPGSPRCAPARSSTMTWTWTGLGVAREGECAYSILATVVSTAVAGRAVVDAGSKALSKELHRTAGAGYAAVAGRPEVRVVALLGRSMACWTSPPTRTGSLVWANGCGCCRITSVSR